MSVIICCLYQCAESLRASSYTSDLLETYLAYLSVLDSLFRARLGRNTSWENINYRIHQNPVHRKNAVSEQLDRSAILTVFNSLLAQITSNSLLDAA